MEVSLKKEVANLLICIVSIWAQWNYPVICGSRGLLSQMEVTKGTVQVALGPAEVLLSDSF
jgi:hypothetical protein